MTQVTAAKPSETADIRPFQINIPEEEVVDLRRRIEATRFPEKETVADFSHGVQLALIQAVAKYWSIDYDWRKIERKLNSYPQCITEIDGLDIHFLHVRSKHADAIPLIVTHGWPGSPIEQLKIIDPLTNPTAHGGNALDAFHVVIPSMAGYAFSGKPARQRWALCSLGTARTFRERVARRVQIIALVPECGAVAVATFYFALFLGSGFAAMRYNRCAVAR